MFKGIKINSVSAREFIFFLLLTTVVAALIKMSKSYNTVYDVALEITEVPLDRTVQTINPSQIEINAQGSGFSLVSNALDAPILKVPFVELNRVADKTFEYSITDNVVKVRNSINGDLTILSMTPSKIAIEIDSVSSKKIPVQPKVSLSYSTGFGSKGELEVEPDSITIVGPSFALNEIEFIETVSKKITEINSAVSSEVDLVTNEIDGDVKLSSSKVQITQNVAKFTEGKIQVPITILNDTDGRVKILPKTAEIIYKVELEDFDSISSSDFVVTCNYSEASESNSYLPLTISRQPEKVNSARLINKQVKFIVVN